MKYTQKELQHFFNNVTIKLRIYNWKIRFIEGSHEGYCWKNKRIIDIGIKNKNIKQLILHEISHINTCRFCNQKHNKSFWKVFDNLMRRFLPNERISESDEYLRSISNGGFYKLCYETSEGDKRDEYN